MKTFCLTTDLIALAQDDSSMKLVTLNAGTMVETQANGPVRKTGLVAVTVGGKPLCVFMRDLEERGVKREQCSE